MSVVIDGESLTIDNLVNVARNKAKISVPDSSCSKIDSCRKMLEKKMLLKFFCCCCCCRRRHRRCHHHHHHHQYEPRCKISGL